jgi:type IV pilus assembly protein PilA
MKELRNSKGFTLIELLVVVAIIGILAAIAIPQYAAYRQRGYDARAMSDLRNLATAEEAYFVGSTTGYTKLETDMPDFHKSQGVVITISEGDATHFVATASHPLGTPSKTFTWDSSKGGLQP